MFRYLQKSLIKKVNTKSIFHNKLLGGVMGFVVGDALGVPVEFQERGSYKPVIDMQGSGDTLRSHNKPPGTWSDDTSMTLCLMENLTEGYNRENLKQLFCNWCYYGYWTYDGTLPFDVGDSTFRVLSRIKSGIAKDETGAIDERSNGNGSLMRVLPLSFYLQHTDNDTKFKMIEEVSGITHAHIRSKIACSLYVEIAINLLNGKSPQVSYEESCFTIQDYYKNTVSYDEMKHFNRILSLKITDYSVDDISSFGYVIDSLEAVLWCFLKANSYEEAVLLAVNLGEDTDTIGAITGGLAGIYYGIEAVPSKWIKKLAKQKEIILLIDSFYKSLEIEKAHSLL